MVASFAKREVPMMKSRSSWFLSLLLLTAPAWATPRGPAGKEAAKEAAPAPDSPALSKLKSLVGEWQGKAGEAQLHASYKAMGGGKCVAENLKVGQKTEMLTVYCADGPAVMVTHYCDGGTQPRLRAEGLSADGKSLDFKFKDIGNLSAPGAPHMHSMKLTFQDGSRFVQEWTSMADGKESPMVFSWSKVR